MLGKLIKTSIVVGIVVNLFDFLVHGVLLQGPLYAHLGILRTETPIPLFVLTDFAAAFVLVWVYDRVRGSFGAGARGGIVFGLYAGVLINFPTWIGGYLALAGWTYGLAWIWTLCGIAWAVVAGAVAGALYASGGATAVA